MAAVLLALALIGGGAALAMPGVMAEFGLTTAEGNAPLDEVPPPEAFAEEVEELEVEAVELEEESLEEGDGPPEDVVAFVECVREFAAGQGDPETRVLGGHDCEKPEGLDDESDLGEGDGPPPEVVEFVACVHEFARGQSDPATRVTGGHDCEPPGDLDGEESDDPEELEELEDGGPPEGVGGPPDGAGPPEGVGGPPEGAGPPGR